MSGGHTRVTGGSFTPAGGITLPAPQVQQHTEDVPPTFFTGQYPLASGSAPKVTTLNQIRVIPSEIPHSVLNRPELELQLELLRYTRRGSRKRANIGKGFQQAGYVHPSTANAPGGSFNRGGSHGGVDVAVTQYRVTEFPVVNQFTAIDVTQAMLAFMVLYPVRMRDVTGAQSTVTALVPSSNPSSNRLMGRRFSYGGVMSPGYFKFRWAVRDLSDPRRKFISGPLSETVCLTNAVFPFVPDADDPNGFAAATVSPLFDATVAKFYIGPTSRLPG